MTNGEMQKAMEFIINQQAQASAKIDALAEALKAEAPHHTETDKRLHALAELVERQIRERRVGNS
ncbi:MAG TPA: hypothetical protein VEW46_08640 [Pyrinomonadaceae bacterium]|nr:hypothetical protein [Pyrinomonadaceae bacterium]